MQFTNPIWLLALSGILVPLAIHLLSRKEGKLIRIGSLRHLEETSTRQFKSIKLNEILLLVLRSLLILLIVLLLSGLHWTSKQSGNYKWVLIEKGLEKDSDVSEMADSLRKDGYQVRAFQTGFPLMTDSIAQHPDDYWSLVDELKQKSLANVVIISSSRVEAFHGMRSTIPENFKWITKELAAKEITISSVSAGSDSTWIRKGKFSSGRTEFETAIEFTKGHDNPAKTLKIEIVKGKDFDYDAKIMEAALKAVDESVPEKIEIQIVEQIQKETTPDFVIILMNEQITTGNKTIQFRQTASSQLLVQEKSSQWIITKRLHSDNAVQGQLTLLLAEVLFPRKEAWKTASANDIRMIDEKLVSTDGQSPIKENMANVNTEPVWIVLLLITLVAERIIAYRKNQ
jgi:hypothetical protein